MVGWLNPTSREDQEDQEEPPQSAADDQLVLDFFDPFSDFDPVEEWLVDPDHSLMPDSEPKVELTQENVISDESGARTVELGHQDQILEPSIHEKMEKVSLVETVEKVEVGTDGGSLDSEVDGGEEMNKSKCSGTIEVCSVSDSIKLGHESNEEEGSEQESEEEDGSDDDSSSESSSSSSSSSGEEDSSSSDEEEVHKDEEREKKAEDKEVEVEEGEIKDYDQEEVILGSDEEEEVPKGPIKSRHEVEDLPPVPRVEVFLESHHQTLPVGVISSILGNRIIVEGSEKHNPLNEGSILWITESRLPLGLIDEIFGPVKNPYYVVRYNSDEEVPAGISVGAAVSLVMEFANHILNEKDLYKKGYDASGDNDEEATDEVEFSDDEKEAEYRRSLRQQKREATQGNQESYFGKKKTNFKGAGFRKDKQPPGPTSAPPTMTTLGQVQPSQPGQLQTLPASGNFGGSSFSANRAGNPIATAASRPMMMPAIMPQPQAFHVGGNGSFGGLNNAGAQGFPPQLHPMGGQGGFPMNCFPNQQLGGDTCHFQHQNQVFNNLAPGLMPYQQQQQFVPNFGAFPGNMSLFGGAMNPSVYPFSPLVGPMGNPGFNQALFGCSNVNPQGNLGFCNEQGNMQPIASLGQGEMRPPMTQFNRGRSSFRGRRPYRRGGRSSFGGRGGHQQNG